MLSLAKTGYKVGVWDPAYPTLDQRYKIVLIHMKMGFK